MRQPNGYREYAEEDLARLRLVVSLRRLGLGPEDAGRMARLCLEHGEVDRDLGPLLAEQRAQIARHRDDLDRLDAELIDLEETIVAAGRARGRRKERPMSDAPIASSSYARATAPAARSPKPFLAAWVARTSRCTQLVPSPRA